ncbi:hypothetical protein CHLRE_13g568150v5 [Chlamydomonas reinhardtii]|uniref:Uncharacterized protein n=1 Tax=Chlamydomonas reinhardtii TaxID=3055 RepID=A0A2K3CZF7_CHLRE|nr:uncharacterized protein CHLRE_13g568150v5 [Chlamydomonas reinhardtii]PNW73675.1 hypothetical protein CHLRE_13g568150v5 [Chlamydomonas reinhardtii]
MLGCQRCMGGLARSASARRPHSASAAVTALRHSQHPIAASPLQGHRLSHTSSSPSLRAGGARTAPAAASPSASASASSPPSPSPSSSPASSPSAEPYPYPHVPVMLREVLSAFAPLHVTSYLDCTLGAGGHASEMVAAHPELLTVYGIDVDPTAHTLAEPRIRAAAAGREGFGLRLLRGNYRDLRPLLGTVSSPPPQPTAILMDLGVSSMQIDTADRGFSFMREGPLDMRMDPTAPLSAEEVLNTWSEAELGRILRDYGEEKLWRVVARRLVQAREVEPIRTTTQLVKAVGHTQIGGKLGKGPKGVHPATRTFQALRIAVNDELRRLEQALPDAIAALAPGGRLAVISFHSLEDRLVKHAFARAAGRPTPEDEHRTYGADKFAFLDELEASRVAVLVGNQKPVLPSEEETARNPRARSAKLRVLQKLGGSGDGVEKGSGGRMEKGKRKLRRAEEGKEKVDGEGVGAGEGEVAVEVEAAGRGGKGKGGRGRRG